MDRVTTEPGWERLRDWRLKRGSEDSYTGFPMETRVWTVKRERARRFHWAKGEYFKPRCHAERASSRVPTQGALDRVYWIIPVWAWRSCIQTNYTGPFLM